MDLINNKLPLNGKDKQSVLVVEDSDEVREFLVTFFVNAIFRL
jgi:hypothetical protein